MLRKAVLLAVGVVVVQGLLILWFAWPASRLAPHDLPIVVAGPPPAVSVIADRLRTAEPGAFDVTTVPDEAGADQALRDRTAYAALVVSPTGSSLHVASAASPTVAAVLTQAASQFSNGQPVTVRDVVPAPPDDPRGAGFASGFLPLLLTSAVLSDWNINRLVGVLLFAVLAGLVGTALLHWLGVLTGGYLAEAGALGLLALAVSATVSGLGAALGPAGIGLGALLGFLLGNPISGLTSAPELLPQPWGVVGQFLPPGAGATLLRSVAFFSGARGTVPLLVLACWGVAGLLLTAPAWPVFIRRSPQASTTRRPVPARRPG